MPVPGSLRHDTDRRSTTLTHTSGAAPYTWEARFPGAHTTVSVDGVLPPARTEVIDGVTCTSVRTRVAPGLTVTVEVR
ncbi:hypothetical protein NRF20_39505 [Streptomyces sp. R-74717]|uniref:hypothetical protein n=1 Tax=Streptomyces TaxID=1883 RepID=UPI0037B10983